MFLSDGPAFLGRVGFGLLDLLQTLEPTGLLCVYSNTAAPEPPSRMVALSAERAHAKLAFSSAVIRSLCHQ